MKKLSAFLAKTVILSFFFLTVAQVMVPVLASDAAAQTTSTVTTTANSNAFVSVMCNAMRLITGNAGKAFAAFAIISMGIGFFTGKISWGLMIGLAMGIAAMFGAPTIVAAISGEGAFDCGRAG